MPAKGLRCLIVSKKMSAFEQVCQKLKGLERVVCYEAEAAKALLSCSSFDYLISYQQISELNGYDGIGLLSHACNHYPKMALLAISENSSSCKLEDCDLGKKVVALRESALLDDIANYFGPQKDVFKARVNFSSLTRVEKLDKFN